jgi:phage protein D
VPETADSSWPVVEVDGAPLAASAADRLVEVTVDHDLHRPDMFVLRLVDTPDGAALEGSRIHIGSRVRVSANALGQTTSETLIDGEVTSIEGHYADMGCGTVVRGYDPSHRLHRGRRATTYRNAKISDIARTIAREAGLTAGAIDDSGAVVEVVPQFGVSDWDFLQGHARELGYELTVTGQKLNFRRAASASTTASAAGGGSRPLELVLGANLVEFRPRLSAGQQIEDVQVRAWDPVAKKVLVGSARTRAENLQLSAQPGTVARTFRSGSHLTHQAPLGSQAEVDAAARSLAERIGSLLCEAEGVVFGAPALRAGVAVSVSGVSKPFVGHYVLTRTQHVFDGDGYRIRFVVSGGEERSLFGLASAGSGHAAYSGGGPLMHGAVIAEVADNDDPQRLGRVRLKFPTLSDSYVSDWARVVQVGAGPDSGAVFLPEVKDEVLCAFEYGDVRRPYVIGGLHNGKDKPRLGDGLVDAGKVTRRGFVSRKGHRIVMLDGDRASGIALLSADGQLRVSLNQTKGQIHIHAKGPVVIDTDSGAVAITGGGDVALEARGQLSLKGTAGVKIESDAAVEVSGKPIKLN